MERGGRATAFPAIQELIDKGIKVRKLAEINLFRLHPLTAAMLGEWSLTIAPGSGVARSRATLKPLLFPITTELVVLRPFAQI